MVCSIAHNRPLDRLRMAIGAPRQCHSLRAWCIDGLAPRSGGGTMGIQGTALGYCQALFSHAGDPLTHTRRVSELLREIDAPWHLSHELFWGHRGGCTPQAF